MLLATARISDYVTHTVLSGSIHRFSLHENTPDTLDAFMVALRNSTVAYGDETGTGRVLVKLAPGCMPPIAHLFATLKLLTDEATLPSPSFVAVVHHGSFMATSLRVFVDLLPRHDQRYVRTFTFEDTERAMDWVSR